MRKMTGISAEDMQEDTVRVKKNSLSSLQDFVAGGFGGVCTVIVGHPFDLVKVRLQTAEKEVYSGAMDVVRKTLAREGPMRGLYAGVSAPLAGVTPLTAVSFWGYGVGKHLVDTFGTVRDGPYSVGQLAAAGLFSALPTTLITAPFERVKIILQIHGQKQSTPDVNMKNTTGIEVVKRLYKEGGITQVYRGSAMTLARDGPGFAVYFATYEMLKRWLSPKDETGNPSKLSLPAVCVAGGGAGVAMWLSIFPLDTIKSRIQSEESNLSIGATIQKVYGRGGVKAFFPGFGPAIARAVPANAATFLGVELAHQAMNKVF